MEERGRRSERLTVADEPVLLVGRSPDEHGILREMICGGPRPVMCRLCKGEQDCPYIADRSALRVKVTYRDPTDPVPPLEHRTVATGAEGMPVHSRHPWVLLAAAAASWFVAAGLMGWFWVLHRPSLREIVAVLGLKVAVFLFVVVGIPLVRLTWSHHGGRFRRSA